MAGPALLVAALRDPGCTSHWSLREWDLAIRQARASRLLGRLCVLIEGGADIAAVPAAPLAHLRGASIVAEEQRFAVQQEVERIQAALQGLGLPVILLKGAAYACADLPPARGRLFSDIDILVDRAALPDVEAALMLAGWASAHHDAYDQRYYRTWMHEIPPLQHLARGTVVDVHHAITPSTCRWMADSERMRAEALSLPGRPAVRVLAPADMILHSATHLFLEGESDGILRDLVDLDVLLRHFGQEAGFWTRLPERAEQVGLGRALYYALRHASRLLGTPVPAEAAAQTRRWAGGALRERLMDALYSRALQPRHPTAEDATTPLARWLLYVRGHWMRMPAHLLAVHLARKALKRVQPQEEAGTEAERDSPR
ncbi:MAG: nucleotidyltransferase family protein [Burkholderiales bacterium]|nr:nucleotidyltransferase family protein [Burkholderiales bacterium]